MTGEVDLLAPTPLEESMRLQAQADIECPEGVPADSMCYVAAPPSAEGADCESTVNKQLDSIEKLLGPAMDSSDVVPGTCGNIRQKPKAMTP